MKTALVELLAALVELWREWKREREAKQRQADADALARDPAGWFRDGFRVQDPADQAAKADAQRRDAE